MGWLAAPLRTERLVLRSLERRDLDAIVDLLVDPEVRRHLGGPVDESVVTAVRSAAVGERWGVFGVADARDDSLVGTVSLDRERGELEVSFQLAPDRWGAGVATEAVAAVVGWVWSNADDRSIVAITQSANARSLRLLERLGFVREEAFEEHGEPQVLLRLTAPAA
jgi:RimJ/RimL family protein N-acetyltransferase